MTIFAIYGPNQVEHPGRYVVRRWVTRGRLPAVADVAPTALAGSLAEARAAVPAGSKLAPRAPGDNVALVESWFAPQGGAP